MLTSTEGTREIEAACIVAAGHLVAAGKGVNQALPVEEATIALAGKIYAEFHKQHREFYAEHKAGTPPPKSIP
jgi:hypothetical protein